jgi:hypothetical protein
VLFDNGSTARSCSRRWFDSGSTARSCTRYYDGSTSRRHEQRLLAGHEMRLEVSSSNFPRFDRNLNTEASPESGTRGVKVTNTVLHDAAHVSAAVVPCPGFARGRGPTGRETGPRGRRWRRGCPGHR